MGLIYKRALAYQQFYYIVEEQNGKTAFICFEVIDCFRMENYAIIIKIREKTNWEVYLFGMVETERKEW